MSDDTFYPARTRSRRAISLGEVVSARAPRSSGPRVEGKIGAQMREDAAAFRDATLIATSCAFDGCDWKFTGRADEGRAEARLHRADAHADVAVFGKRCHVPGCDKRAKQGEKACVAHANKPALREVAAVGERAGSGAASGTDLLRREPERAAASPTAGPSAQITLDHLASGPRRVGELAALRGCSAGVIDQHVRALLAKGLIRRVSRGVYERLPEAA